MQKNQCVPRYRNCGPFTQMLRVMRLTALFITVFCVQLSAKTIGQEISFTGKEVPLETVFSSVRQQTGHVFFFKKSILRNARPVTISVTKLPLQQFLDAIFKEQPLEYTIENENIFVRSKTTVSDITAETAPRPVFTDEIPQNEIMGTVKNMFGEPLSGASVVVKRTGKGTQTDAKGEFIVKNVLPDDVLVISFTGYKQFDFKVQDGSSINIILELAVDDLDEAIVQGYGKTTRRSATGNIAKVSAVEIEKQPVLNPLLALQGRVAGLEIKQNSGYASAPIKVELRGRPNLNNNFTSDPLYIIDGVPLTVLDVSSRNDNLYVNGSRGFLQSGLNGPASGQNPLFSLNPADIESIEVLKDADATAIYGSRGANGVILITTKKGSSGKTKFDLHIQQGITKITKFYKLMNTHQYVAMRKEALNNDGIEPDLNNGDYDLLLWDTGRYTDWQRVLYGGTGKTSDAQLGLSGGNAYTNFRLGAGYNHTRGITTVQGADQRASFSFNLSHATTDRRFNISFSSSYSFAQSDMINISGSALFIPPNAPSIYDGNGNLNFEGWGNSNTNARNAYPFSSLKQPYGSKTNFLNSSLNLNYQVVKGLNLSASIGYNTAQASQETYITIASQDSLRNPTGTAMFGNTNNKNWIIEPQVNYNSLMGRGKISLLFGGSLQQTNTAGNGVAGSGFTSDFLIQNMSSAGSVSYVNYMGMYKYIAAYARVTYSLKDRYILNLTGRRDGSSRFGEGKQFGNFGSAGLAWVFSEERPLRNLAPFISFGKIRINYGFTGSDAVGDYCYLTRVSADGTLPYGGVNSLTPTQHANPKFHWSTNKKLEAAIDFGFLRDRINISVAYYRNRCDDQLVNFPTPWLSGFNNVIANSPALVENAGLEITGVIKFWKTKEFKGSISFNSAYNRNKLVSYPNFEMSPYTNVYVIGKPLNIIRLLHYTGVDPETGLYTYEDKNQDGVVSRSSSGEPEDDYVVDLTPNFQGGLGINLSYKSLQLNLYFTAKNQTGIDARAQIPYFPGAVGNQPQEIVGKQWSRPGEVGTVSRFTTRYNSENAYLSISDALYTDASFVRLTNLSLAYSLPTSYINKIGMESCSVFIHSNNIFLITNYKGGDPETQNFGYMPPSKTIVAGLNFNF